MVLLLFTNTVHSYYLEDKGLSSVEHHALLYRIARADAGATEEISSSAQQATLQTRIHNHSSAGWSNMLCALRHHYDECRLACHLPQDCDGGNDVQHILPGDTTLRAYQHPPHGYGCGSGSVYYAQHPGREFPLLDIAGHNSLRGNYRFGKTLYGT